LPLYKTNLPVDPGKGLEVPSMFFIVIEIEPCCPEATFMQVQLIIEISRLAIDFFNFLKFVSKNK
jgi:hypothetical protein